MMSGKDFYTDSAESTNIKGYRLIFLNYTVILNAIYGLDVELCDTVR